MTAISIWQATLQVPGRVIPRNPEIERAVLLGERKFEEIGCAACHMPRLLLDKEGKESGRVEGRFVLTRQANTQSPDLANTVVQALERASACA